MHIIPLGHLGRTDDGTPNVTLQDPVTGAQRGFNLTQENYDLLNGIDPTADRHTYTAEERRFLVSLSKLGVVALVGDKTPLADLDFIPVVRDTVALEEMLDDGYRFTTTLGGPFVLSEYGARLLQQSDGKTLSEIVTQVRADALADPEDAAAIENGTAEQGVTFEDFLLTEVYALVKAVQHNDAVTFERKLIEA